MNDAEVASLYRHPQVKAMVSLTRGEGFGLPILEAAASALPVITTDWSGHTDFMKLGKYIGVQYQLSEIHQTRVDDKIFIKGSRWAQASEEDFKKRLIKFRNSSSTPKEWAIELSEKIKNEYSFNSISKKYDDVLGDVIS
jgi:glycosyltransferase involved in cell wall biosynthesis